MTGTVAAAEELLAGLDAGQRQAAEALRGPVCVLAGAGTGKTRAITHRIAYGIATGAYAPNRVLALTFTTRAAAELRGRLRALGAGPVAARTFHAAALSQLNYFWPQVAGGGLPRVLDSKGRILGHAAERLRIRVDTSTLRDVAAEIEWRKVSGLGIDEYARLAGRRPMPGGLAAEQMIMLHQAYEDLKDERRQIDFEDVLLTCTGMIRSEPAVAMRVREQYRFFVVDEYQDVSPLQQELLDAWLGERRDVCVVGDASQTIYSFAGASSEYLTGFATRYEDATVVRLDQNYRSSRHILETANRLMRSRPGALTLRTAQDAVVAEAVEPTLKAHASETAEARAVAAAIRERIDAGERPESMAILYRLNVQSAPFETALAAAGVGFQIRGAQRFFERPEVKQAVMSLRAASVSISGEPLFKSVSDVLRSLGWSQDPPEATGVVRERWDALNALMSLADQAPEGTSFRAFTDDLMERAATQYEPAVSAITLATLHSAKGLEWDCVHLAGLSEGLVPIGYARTAEAIEEERRLLYVGITRARRRLSLTWSRTGQRGRPQEPSRFLAELGIRSPDA